jgi:hypothetical protein
MNITPSKSLWRLIFLVFILASAAGCSKTFVVRSVSSPQNVYAPATQAEPESLAINDLRGEADKPLNIGTLNVAINGMENEISYLGENLVQVLRSEGISATYEKSGAADITLKVYTYRIRNLRTSGFSPYHTFTTFSADLISDKPPRRVTAYFKNSKVPVWAFREVERPCYQIPMDVIVKEIAAKLNAYAFGRMTPTETVNKIVASITTGPADAASEEYLKVLELGYTNNPAAVEPLVHLTNREEVLMRASAISALGTLGAKDQLPLLKDIYATSDKIVKSMALKSIGDFDTPETREFMRSVKQSKDYSDETIREVVDLYITEPTPHDG